MRLTTSFVISVLAASTALAAPLAEAEEEVQLLRRDGGERFAGATLSRRGGHWSNSDLERRGRGGRGPGGGGRNHGAGSGVGHRKGGRKGGGQRHHGGSRGAATTADADADTQGGDDSTSSKRSILYVRATDVVDAQGPIHDQSPTPIHEEGASAEEKTEPHRAGKSSHVHQEGHAEEKAEVTGTRKHHKQGKLRLNDDEHHEVHHGRKNKHHQKNISNHYGEGSGDDAEDSADAGESHPHGGRRHGRKHKRPSHRFRHHGGEHKDALPKSHRDEKPVHEEEAELHTRGLEIDELD